MTPLRRNTVASIAGRATTVLLWVAVTPYVLDRLGAERFGIWALFFAFTSYLVSLDLGISSTMIRFISAERASGDRGGLTRTLRRGLRLALGLGVLWAVVVVLARGWIAKAFRVPEAMTRETLEALLVFAVGVLLLFPTQVLTGSLQGFERLDLSNLCVVLGVAAQVLVLYLGLAAGGGLTGVAAAGVLAQAVTGLLAAFMLWKQLRNVGPGEQSSGPSWRDLLHFGAALQVTGFLVVLQFQLGKILLGLLGNLAMVADYELAFRVASGVAGIPVLILGAVVPTVSRAWESEGPAAVTPIYTSTIRWLYTSGVMALGLLWLLAPDITRVWLGRGHDHIVPLTRLWPWRTRCNLSGVLAPRLLGVWGSPGSRCIAWRRPRSPISSLGSGACPDSAQPGPSLPWGRRSGQASSRSWPRPDAPESRSGRGSAGSSCRGSLPAVWALPCAPDFSARGRPSSACRPRDGRTEPR